MKIVNSPSRWVDFVQLGISRVGTGSFENASPPIHKVAHVASPCVPAASDIVPVGNFPCVVASGTAMRPCRQRHRPFLSARDSCKILRALRSPTR